MTRIQLNDIHLHVEDQGSGPPLLLVHGFPLSHTMWREQLAALSGSHRVIAPDLRGFGSSGVTEGTVTMQQYADDLAALLEVLEVEQPVAYCGLSMGGYIGWQFLQRHTEKLACLIACDSRAAPDSIDAAHARRMTAQNVLSGGLQELVGGMLPKLFSADTQRDNPDLVHVTSQQMLSSPAKGVAAALRGMAERPDMTSELSQIKVPTLFVCGSQDAITPPNEMAEMANQVPNAQFVEIESAGHMAPLERPGQVNKVLESFLANSMG